MWIANLDAFNDEKKTKIQSKCRKGSKEVFDTSMCQMTDAEFSMKQGIPEDKPFVFASRGG